MRFRKEYVRLELSREEMRFVRDCLIWWRNGLIAGGIPTDDVDGILKKILRKIA